MSAPSAYWQLPRFSCYAAELVRYYSRRSDFTTRLTTSIDTACVIPSAKQVLINPEWEPCANEHLLRVHVSGHERLVLTLEGLAAHEAAHIRFSGDWPGGLLGQLVNALEDERIERLQAQDFPLQRAFDFLGDYSLLSCEPNEEFFTVRAGVLLWRFQHDFPVEIWRTDEKSWEEVQPLVEEAWEAFSTDEVIAIAREIMDILGLDEDTPEVPLLLSLGVQGEGEAAPAAGEGEGSGKGAGGKPQEPTDDQVAFEELDERLALARPLAAQLERLLKVPRQEGKVFSRSRGRLNVRRVIRGEGRPFEQRPVVADRARRVLLVQDISGSMGEFISEHPHYHALVTALALELTTSRLGIGFGLITFEDDATLKRPFGMNPQEALLKVASVETSGGTLMQGALELAQQHARQDDLVFILCDGLLAEADASVSRALAKRLAGTLIPILIGERASPEQFVRIFGRVFPVERAEEIPSVIKRALLAQTTGVL